MRIKAFYLMTGIFLMMILAACSSNPQGQDPSSVKVELVTAPSPVQAAQKVKMIAQISGLINKEAEVQFDIRKADNSGLPELLNAQSDGSGHYFVEKTFDQPGSYTVYIHLAQGELHLTKKKQLVVS